ncbi:hypothetical protein [Brevundimonas lenta]|uniref:DUF3016 domain-containing protein n=1 Tax=Brevundimonas lenta TaxID=424796 RepID=A0A7W6JC63_9CAUL|nr:hypothetical protein [Brevundimonas lenta]MBB4082431.1 hypothetical protein [Brevundimonas lenta]
MRTLAFFAPLAAAVALAAPSFAEPASITVTLSPEVQEQARDLGADEVQQQADRLTELVTRAVADTPALSGARIELVLADVKPNRPTREQSMRNPSLDPIRSISLGGATIEGQITMADGSTRPVRYDWYSNNLRDVRGYTTWGDADTAFRRLASNLADGRYESR